MEPLSSSSELAQDPVLDLTMISRFKYLDPDGSKGLVKQIVEQFLQATPREMEQLRSCNPIMQSEEIVKIAHHLKSSCANLGLTRLATIFQKLEDFEVPSSEISEYINLIEIELNSGFDAIRKIVKA